MKLGRPRGTSPLAITCILHHPGASHAANPENFWANIAGPGQAISFRQLQPTLAGTLLPGTAAQIRTYLGPNPTEIGRRRCGRRRPVPATEQSGLTERRHSMKIT